MSLQDKSKRVYLTLIMVGISILIGFISFGISSLSMCFRSMEVNDQADYTEYCHTVPFETITNSSNGVIIDNGFFIDDIEI